MPLLGRPIVVLCLLASLVAGAGMSLSAALDWAPSTIDTVLDVPSIPSKVARVLALGFLSAACDANYLEAVQVYGDRALRKANVVSKARHSMVVYRLLDYATDLDPHFDYAYVFGAQAVPIPALDGDVMNGEETMALLKKGADNTDDDWRVPFNYAYFLDTYTGDIPAAAVQMDRAARMPRRPNYVPLLATRLAAVGGSIETGITLSQAMAAEADTPEEKAEYEERTRLLVMERDLRAMEDAVRAYTNAHGHPPDHLGLLVEDKLMPALPKEPHGGEYGINGNGVVASSGAPRLKLPDSVRREIDQRAQLRQQWLGPSDSPGAPAAEKNH